MSKAAELKRRLAALTARMTGTFAARLATLTASERTIYDDWRERCRRHIDQHSGAAAYDRMINYNDYSPEMPPVIQRKLSDPPPAITVNMSLRDAAEIYQQYLVEGPSS